MHDDAGGRHGHPLNGCRVPREHLSMKWREREREREKDRGKERIETRATPICGCVKWKKEGKAREGNRKEGRISLSTSKASKTPK